MGAEAQICPTVSYISAGCASSTGEKPTLSVQGDFTRNSTADVVIQHSSLFGVAAVLAGQETIPVLVDGCLIVTTGAEVIVPLLPDVVGQSTIPIPLALAISGQEFVIQASEYEVANDSWFVSDGMRLDFEDQCVSVFNLLAELSPGSSVAGEAFYELLKYDPVDVFPALVNEIQFELSNPTPGDLCDVGIHHPIVSASPSDAPCLNRGLALCYVMEAIRLHSKYPHTWSVMEDFLDYSTEAHADLGGVTFNWVLNRYLSWAQSLADFERLTLWSAADPMEGTTHRWRGYNHSGLGLGLSGSFSSALESDTPGITQKHGPTPIKGGTDPTDDEAFPP